MEFSKILATKIVKKMIRLLFKARKGQFFKLLWFKSTKQLQKNSPSKNNKRTPKMEARLPRRISNSL